MNWLFFALLAPALYALVVFIDKYVVSKEVKDYRGMPLFAAIMGLLSGTFIWFVTGKPTLPTYDTIIVFTSGILTAISFIMYYKAVLDEEASNINLFFQMGPIFILILAFIFLSEQLTLKQFLGFAIIFYAVFTASLSPTQKGQKIRISKALVYILIYDLLWAISAILMKLALDVHTFGQIVSYQNWGVALGGMGIFCFVPSVRNPFLKSLGIIRKRAMGMIMLNELFFVLARSVTYLAYSLGSVAIVSVLEGTQVFYGIFYGWLFTTLMPRSFNEDIGRKTLMRKIILAGIVFVGILLVH